MDIVVTGGSDGEGGGTGPLVVLMHGFGAPGDDLASLGSVLGGPPGTRYVFPAAPIDLGPAFAGGRAWWNLDLEARMRRQALGIRDITEVPDGLHEASDLIVRLLAALKDELAPPQGKVVLGGFSQGAMLALDVALRSTCDIAGLLLLSGTHIASGEWAPLFETRRGLPVLQSHGRSDEILPISVSEHLRDVMLEAKWDVEWVPFEGGHGIPPVVVTRARAFLDRVLA
ncbi:MAG: hypothetical protein U0174_03950 [Polyangiaceae bacterium]